MADALTRLQAAFAGRYVIEREIGRGGMATVYLAHDVKHDRAAAIKVFDPEAASAIAIERFLREIKVAARLQHPHILPLYDSGTASAFLYYVMPYVAGESLRERLEREKQLRLEDALRITREVAEALEYAHHYGIVHRDIKPANILLADDQAMVVDFGVARAFAAAGEEKLTQTGLAVGTLGYMSPEQASGSARVDGRSDIYSLGCVSYEMLAGSPPFTGSTPQAILARHLADPVPPLRTVRRSVPLSVEQAILRALEKVPADRYATVTQFADALEAPASPARPRLRPKLVAGLAAAAAAAALYWVVAIRSSASRGAGRGGGGGAADTSRYVILPFVHAGAVTPLNEGELLQDALTHWSGIAVVDPFQVRDALARRDGRSLSGSDARAVALDLGAGRYVRGEVSHIGDSVRVYAALYDVTRGGSFLRDGTVKLGSKLAKAEAAFATLGERLLFGSAGPGARVESQTGTSSFPARQAYAQGHAAIERWDLAAADSAFAAATRYDAQYAQAFLWLSQTRSWMAQGRAWSDTPVATWQSAAERAAAGRGRLSSRDQLLSDALLALGRGEVDRACRVWTRLTVVDPYDFASWYGLANCLSRDDVVQRDPTTASGWRFRSSYQQAIRAYVRAFQLLPSIHRSLRGGSYESVRQLLMTGGNNLRMGRAVAPDTTVFSARPVWQGDTLALLPYPRTASAGPEVVPEAVTLAARHQRELFHEVATAWVTAFPRSADALEALAIALEMLGDPAALDTLRRASALATTPTERVRIAVGEVWMLVKFSVPADVAGLHAARASADSVLRSYPPPNAPEPLLLAGLAALTGHAQLAAEYGREPSAAAEWIVPAPLARTALPLVLLASLGGPADSLRTLEQLVDSSIDNGLAMPLRQQARLQWLARAATLAFPDYRFKSITKLAGAGDYLLDGQAAFLRGDTASVHRLYAELRAARRHLPPAELTLDALYPEAWLLGALGDDRAAIEWLDPTLVSLLSTPPEVFTEPARAGSLIRAMALRADLAVQVGDHVASARWAAAVAAFWSEADPFLQPLVRRMRRLAG